MKAAAICFHPQWQNFERAIRSWRSVVICAPRTFQIHHSVVDALPSISRSRVVRTISVSSSGQATALRLDWAELWKSISQQSGARTRASVTDAITFRNALGSLCISRECDRLRLLVHGSGRSNVQNQSDLLRALDSVLRLTEVRARLQVVAFDDYSMFFFDNQRIGTVSRLEWFDFLEFSALSRGAFVQAFVGRQRRGHVRISNFMNDVYMLTGGHPRLVDDARVCWAGRSPDREALRESLRKSGTASDIARSISGSASQLLESVAYYRRPRPLRANNRADQVLVELGVLTMRSPGTAVDCGSFMRDLVSELAITDRCAPAKSRGERGSFPASARSTSIALEIGDVSEDDIVVVHLSDPHFGENHDYRIDWGDGRTQNPERRYLHEVILTDLRSLGLLRRIDGIIVTGDFAETGNAREFRHAREMVRALRRALSLPARATLLVAGNHDVTWPPKRAPQKVMRADYEDFIRQLGKPARCELADCILLHSRSGRRMLTVIGVDSNAVEGPGASGIGYVSDEALRRASTLAKRVRRCPTSQMEQWLVLHHHVLPVTSSLLADAAERKVSVLANAPAVLTNAKMWGVHAILHGHQHQPHVTCARSWPTSDGTFGDPLVVIGAGSSGVGPLFRGPAARNHYFILQSRQAELLVHSRITGEIGEAFTFHARLNIPALW